METTAPLRRSRSDAKVAGVCAGLARAWNIDPVILRVAVAALALTGGAGVLLYLAGWLLIPAEGTPPRTGATQGARGSFVRGAAVAVLILAGIALLGRTKPMHVAPAVILGLFGYLAFYRPRRRRVGSETATQEPASQPPVAPRPSPAGFQTSAAPAPDPDQASRPLSMEELEELSHARFLAVPDPVGLYIETAPPAAPAPSRPGRSPAARRLRLACLAAVAVALTVLAVVDSFGGGVPFPAYLAVAVLGVGLSLVAATWLGRARGLLPAGVLLSLALLGTTLAGTVDRAHWQPDAAPPLTSLPTTPLVRESGTAVNLSEVAMTHDATVTARAERGTIAVTVPRNVNVVVRYDIGAGALMVLENDVDMGRNLRGQTTPVRPDPGRPTLTLNLSVERGAIWVQR